MSPLREESISSGSSHSSTGKKKNKCSTTAGSERENERKTLASKENKAVGWLRVIAFLLLLCTAAGVSTVIYRGLKNNQLDDFDRGFEADATKVIDSFHRALAKKLTAIDAFAGLYTSHAQFANAIWPNVTLPDFEMHASNARVLADVYSLGFHPVVTEESREGWEAYSKLNRNSYEEAYYSEIFQLGIQDDYFNHTPREPITILASDWYDTIAFTDFEGAGEVVPAPKNSGPYLPVFQVSPVVNRVLQINYNTLPHPSTGPSYAETLRTGQAVFGAASNIEGELGEYARQIFEKSQYRYDFEKLLVEPESVLGYPVFDTFEPKTRKVVGLIGTPFVWRLLLINLLPPNARGIICVLTNSFGQSLTYRIDGGEAEYLGDEDLHDPKYDDDGYRGNIAEYLASQKSPKTRSYTAVDLNSEYGDYSLCVYPSDDYASQYIDVGPVHFSLIIGGVFLFTSLVFITYDYLVARRQKIVLDRAVESSAIVSSLFPSAVRRQVYQENRHASSSTVLLAEQSSSDHKSLPSHGIGVIGSMPIAEQFDNTTVLFADIAGFTAWSSSRTAVQVFTLLENIYQVFDEVACRHKVFKVETIGDCYVAVTGVPEAQENHAVIMAMFARDCANEMARLKVSDVFESLGEDTATLDMRFGLHSGSVTGGVLRGQKSRYQLFGDTMNTAARMESNGIKGKVHVSKSTADALKAKGKSHWLTPRGNQIDVKGKGLMQTYWVSIGEEESLARASPRHDM